LLEKSLQHFSEKNIESSPNQKLATFQLSQFLLATAININTEISSLYKNEVPEPLIRCMENQENLKTIFQKIKENKLTYLAFGIVAGFIVAYAYKNYLKKE